MNHVYFKQNMSTIKTTAVQKGLVEKDIKQLFDLNVEWKLAKLKTSPNRFYGFCEVGIADSVI